jgi:hypothetical protein
MGRKTIKTAATKNRDAETNIDLDRGMHIFSCRNRMCDMMNVPVGCCTCRSCAGRRGGRNFDDRCEDTCDSVEATCDSITSPAMGRREDLKEHNCL